MGKVKKESKKAIELYLEVKTLKNKDNEAFNVYKTQIGGLSLDVKFRKDAEHPVMSGYYKFMCEDLNLDTSNKYPCLWVRK